MFFLVRVWKLGPGFFFMILGAGATNPLLELYVEEFGAPRGEAGRITGYMVSAMAAVTIVAMPRWGRRGEI